MSILTRLWRRLHVSAAANQRKRLQIALKAAGAPETPALPDKWTDADQRCRLEHYLNRTQKRAVTYNGRVVGAYYLN